MNKFIYCICICTAFAKAQDDTLQFKTIIPGKHYAAGPVHRFFFGNHWRNLWTSPMRVKELDLDHFAGGLTPAVRGGGFQTRSLRFYGKDGREYKFRSLDKDPTRILPDDLADTFVEDVVQDQISWSHPYSSILSSPFVKAAGILQADPQLVILPESNRLGEFREEFGGLLGTLEENPDDKDGIIFRNADKIKNTYSLFRELDDDNDEQIDAAGYLTARLIDIFLGDWDRHVDQWKWAGYTNGGKRIWKPIPRDRDQAFAKIDGLFPWGVTYFVRQIESYETVFPLIEDLTWSGRHLDRKFLPSLSKSQWDSVTNAVVGILTDSVISYAVHLMPDTMVQLEGTAMESKLRERRDRLRQASEDFYALNAVFPEIHCSNKNEYVEIGRINDESVDVTIWKREKNSGNKKESPIFSRRFFTDETKEIRLYLKDGDDYGEITGTVQNSIELHIFGGKGKDTIIDRSVVGGFFLGVVPIPSSEQCCYIYDNGKQSEIMSGPSTVVITRTFDPPATDTALYEPVRDYGHDFLPVGIASYNSADGIVAGFGQTIVGYGVKYDPYFYTMKLSLAYATSHKALRADIHSIVRTYDKDLSYVVNARLSGLEVLRYFGSGNEVPLNISTENNTFYNVQQGQYSIDPQIQYRLGKQSSLHVGTKFKYSTIHLDDSTYIKVTVPYGTSDMSIVNVHAGIEFDSRNHPMFPENGALIRADAAIYPKLLDNKFPFTRSQCDVRWFTGVKIFSPTILAFRIYGEKIFGTYPFYEASYLGGTTSVRGFEKQRFSGDGSLSLHSEARFHLGIIKVLLPITIGGTVFGETGRVFVKGEQSTLWHSGFGAGVWAFVLNKEITVSVSLARSKEELEGHFTTGFTF